MLGWEMHRRVLAKLRGFIEPPDQTFRQYPLEDTRVEARYARAIAYYKQADFDAALREVDALVARFPDDPYFIEFKAQLLFEHGHVAESAALYARVVDLLPEVPLLRVQLAGALLALPERKQVPVETIVMHLRKVLDKEPGNADAWRKLAAAYGKAGEDGQSFLALAEEAYALKNKDDTLLYAEKALAKLTHGTPSWQRAQDLKALVEGMEE